MTNTYKPDQQKLAAGLTRELFDVLSKYEEAIMLSTVVGVLETLKFELIHRQHHELRKEMQGQP